MPTSTHAHRIAVIGPSELISILEGIGIDTFPATTFKEAEQHIATICMGRDASYAILCVTESIAQCIPEAQKHALAHASLPAFLVLPDLTADKDTALAHLRTLATRATGSDILGV